MNSHPLIAEDAVPFGHIGEPQEHFSGVLGMTAIHARHDRRRGTIDFEMRVTDPVPTRAQLILVRRNFDLSMRAVARGGETAEVGFGVPPSGTLFGGGFGSAKPREVSSYLSPDRRLLRFRLTDSRLRSSTFSRLVADIDTRPDGLGPGADEHVSTFFNLPLEHLSARMREGRLTIGSAPGARLEVSIRRNRERPRVVRYRQTSLERSDTKLSYRFCPRRARYTIAIRARDIYGNRRTRALATDRSSACAPAPSPLIAAREVEFQTRDAIAGPRRRMLDIIGLRAEHDRSDATMLFQLRLGRPLPKRPTDRFAFTLAARHPVEGEEVNTAIDVGPGGSSATYGIGFAESDPDPAGTARLVISRDRKRLRVRVKDPRLRPKRRKEGWGSKLPVPTYTHLIATSGRSTSRGRRPRAPEETVETFFSLPLKKVGLQLRRGVLRIRTAQGAHVRAEIRRNEAHAKTVRYRQFPLNEEWTFEQWFLKGDWDLGKDTFLRYRLACRTPGTLYTVTVHARDRYGHRRAANLRKRCR